MFNVGFEISISQFTQFNTITAIYMESIYIFLLCSKTKCEFNGNNMFCCILFKVRVTSNTAHNQIYNFQTSIWRMILWIWFRYIYHSSNPGWFRLNDFFSFAPAHQINVSMHQYWLSVWSVFILWRIIFLKSYSKIA